MAPSGELQRLFFAELPVPSLDLIEADLLFAEEFVELLIVGDGEFVLVAGALLPPGIVPYLDVAGVDDFFPSLIGAVLFAEFGLFLGQSHLGFAFGPLPFPKELIVGFFDLGELGVLEAVVLESDVIDRKQSLRDDDLVDVAFSLWDFDRVGLMGFQSQNVPEHHRVNLGGVLRIEFDVSFKNRIIDTQFGVGIEEPPKL